MFIIVISPSGTGHGAVDAAIMWALGLAGASSKPPPPASSLLGACGHLAVVFDERPETKIVRAKALQSLAAKAQAVVGAGGVGDM